MTTATYRPVMLSSGGVALTCEVLVSHCDDADFDGDWRYAAFCPDLDAAMDGRSVDEAVQRLHDAIVIKLEDCVGVGADAGPALAPPMARAEAVADFLADGRLIQQTTLRIERS